MYDNEEILLCDLLTYLIVMEAMIMKFYYISVKQIWYDNVPHPKLVEYKKDQHWVVKSGEYLKFPGGGTQFKDGVDHYIEFIEKV
jgi:hypothetical protein